MAGVIVIVRDSIGTIVTGKVNDLIPLFSQIREVIIINVLETAPFGSIP